MKKILLFTIIILFISGCINLPTREDFVSTPECKKWALERIPKEYELFEGKERDTWFDKDNMDIIYSKGTFKGENVNYYYYRGGMNKPLTISETITDQEGNILGTRKIEYFPILEPIPQTDEVYQTIVGIKRLRQEFKLHDIQVKSCVLEN